MNRTALIWPLDMVEVQPLILGAQLFNNERIIIIIASKEEDQNIEERPTQPKLPLSLLKSSECPIFQTHTSSMIYVSKEQILVCTLLPLLPGRPKEPAENFHTRLGATSSCTKSSLYLNLFHFFFREKRPMAVASVPVSLTKDACNNNVLPTRLPCHVLDHVRSECRCHHLKFYLSELISIIAPPVISHHYTH